MKKILTVLAVLTIVAFAVFADETPAAPTTLTTETHRITVESPVAQVLPVFKFSGSFDSAYGTVGVADDDPAEAFSGTRLATEDSIADKNIYAYFKISQANTATNYSRYNKTVKFKITVGDLTEQDPKEGEDAATVDGHITAVTAAATAKYEGYNGNNESVNLDNAVENEVKTFTAGQDNAVVEAAYNGKVVNQDIATFACAWYRKDSLPNGLYKADITVKFEAI